MTTGQEDVLLARITVDPQIFGGKPIVRGCRLAVEHLLAGCRASSGVFGEVGRLRGCAIESAPA
jgi:uncharacterized protein (DUF433 family)